MRETSPKGPQCHYEYLFYDPIINVISFSSLPFCLKLYNNQDITYAHFFNSSFFLLTWL